MHNTLAIVMLPSLIISIIPASSRGFDYTLCNVCMENAAEQRSCLLEVHPSPACDWPGAFPDREIRHALARQLSPPPYCIEAAEAPMRAGGRNRLTRGSSCSASLSLFHPSQRIRCIERRGILSKPKGSSSTIVWGRLQTRGQPALEPPTWQGVGLEKCLTVNNAQSGPSRGDFASASLLHSMVGGLVRGVDLWPPTRK